MQESARYHVRNVERSMGPYGKTVWKITFRRVGTERDTIELTVHAAVFAAMDLDAEYTAGDLMRLREAGGG